MPIHRALFLAVALITAAAGAEDLTWTELVRRPEFWPTHTTVKQAFKLPGSNSVIAGQRVAVVALRDNEVEVETLDRRGTFAVKADGTDVLTVARNEWKRLSVEQRALTYVTLLTRKDLWPYRVRLLQTVRLKTGSVNSGESLVLKDVEGGNLLVASVGTRTLFTLPPASTNLMESARHLLQYPNSSAGRITEDLNGKLTSPLTGAPAPLAAENEPRFYAFYRGAAWCAPCRQFSPDLAKFYKEMKRRRPQFEIVYISGDKSAAELSAYARQAGFSWRTVTSGRQSEMQLVNRLFTENIPQLVVTDRHGNVLVDSAKIGTAAALQQLDALVEKG